MALKIIGAGFGRTGTASLKVALEMLGYSPCYHMSEVLREPHRVDHWLQASNGDPDWETTFAGYTAAVDFPTAAFYRELAAHFPDAKVLLTVRDAGQWFESVNETIMGPQLRAMVENTSFGEMNRRAFWRLFDERLDDREHMVTCFNNHVEAVRSTIPADRLLVYEIKQGWAPLCAFLDRPVPDEPFPRVNSRDETKAFLAALANDNGQGINNERAAETARTLHGE